MVTTDNSTDLEITLYPELFGERERQILQTGEWIVTAWRYLTGIVALRITNTRGYVEVLPFMGQILWDAVFDGQSLRMDSMFEVPVQARQIVETYGCFAFHSGLLAAGCPSPEDDHPLHGEFPCAPMRSAKLVTKHGPSGVPAVTLVSEYEYCMGFGHHYLARPTVTLRTGSATFDISLEVTNLSKYQSMPLQYMCHMNYAFIPEARMSQSLPDGAFQLHRSVPSHVTPTRQWSRINEEILAGDIDADSLVGAEAFDPEIVYFADDLPKYGETVEFRMQAHANHNFVTRFRTDQFPVATRWILHNADQRVAAYVLPGTSRPEGRLAAEAAGTLIHLAAGAARTFSVTTGLLAPGEAFAREVQ